MKKYFLTTIAFLLLICPAGCAPAGSYVAVPEPDIKYAALTFDDGPYTPVTGRILDTLEKYNARATFFVVGNRAEIYPQSVKRAYDLGCEIGNHTYSHADLCAADIHTVRREISRCSDVIFNITGERECLFRPTGGKNSVTLQSGAGRALILWSIDTRDWAHHDCGTTARIIRENICDGSIILMHDLEMSSAECCEKLIPELVEQGYQLVTVSELLRLNGIGPEAGRKYYSAFQSRSAIS